MLVFYPLYHYVHCSECLEFWHFCRYIRPERDSTEPRQWCLSLSLVSKGCVFDFVLIDNHLPPFIAFSSYSADDSDSCIVVAAQLPSENKRNGTASVVPRESYLTSSQADPLRGSRKNWHPLRGILYLISRRIVFDILVHLQNVVEHLVFANLIAKIMIRNGEYLNSSWPVFQATFSRFAWKLAI